MANIDLAYDDAGDGGQTFLLIHGAFGRRSDYVRQIEYFSPTSRVIAVDLRGHGDSDAPESGYSISQFAEDVATLANGLDLEKVNVVGHSMGGVIAVELGSRFPELVGAIATLDSPSIIPGWHDQHTGPYGEAMHGPNYRQVLREFLDVASSATDDAERRAESEASIERMSEHAIFGTWDAIGDWDPELALRDFRAPFLYLDHGQPDLDFDLLRTFAPQVVTGKTVGAGHRALLEVPDQVNAMLDRFFSLAPILSEEARSSVGGFRYRADGKKGEPVGS
ncbi:MAG TPA: alpha/beta hydrolase [Acidimicrobiia bacterium]